MRSASNCFPGDSSQPYSWSLGCDETRDQLMARFYWPGIHPDVCQWCASCRVNPTATPRAQLRPLTLIATPFERIGMDLIGPLDSSAQRYRFALVIVDYYRLLITASGYRGSATIPDP